MPEVNKLDKFALIIFALIQAALESEKCILINQKYAMTHIHLDVQYTQTKFHR